MLTVITLSLILFFCIIILTNVMSINGLTTENKNIKNKLTFLLELNEGNKLFSERQMKEIVGKYLFETRASNNKLHNDFKAMLGSYKGELQPQINDCNDAIIALYRKFNLEYVEGTREVIYTDPKASKIKSTKKKK